MSYREENGKVVLTMSREDYDFVAFNLGACITAQAIHQGSLLKRLTEVVNRLNEGNPNYTPYQVEQSCPTNEARS